MAYILNQQQNNSIYSPKILKVAYLKIINMFWLGRLFNKPKLKAHNL